MGSLPVPQVPDHELLRRIGQGGYGEVWLARNVMGTYRAVKIVYRGSFDHDRPFEREFEGICRFEPVSRTHESQLNVLHVGRGESYFYYVMELADDQGHGQNIHPDSYAPRTLRSELHQHGRLPFEQCLQIALVLTRALEHLHGHGLVHRDIKPSNVIFVGGVPKLADIGLVAQADATLSFVGTEGYVPPEGPGSPQADLYSLGKLLYEINTGRDRQDYPELPTDLRLLSDREGVVELNEVIIKACHNEPRRRYATAREMHEDLVLLQGGKSLAKVHALERRLAKMKQVARVGGVVSLVIAGGFLWQAQHARRMARLAAANLELAKTSQQKADENRRQLARTEIVTGADLMNQGDLLGSLPWFCGAARLEKNDPAREAMHLFRIDSVLRQCPQLSQIFFHDGRIGLAAFDHDGKRVVTGSADRTARVWDLATGKPIGLALKHEDELTAASFRPDGNRLATASREKTVRVWDIESGQLIYSLPHPETVFLVSFSPDASLLLTVSRDGQRVWNTETRELLYPVVPDPGRPGGLSPDGRYFVTVGPTARVREARTGRLVLETSPSELVSAAFSPDSRRLITGGSDGLVQAWDIASGQAFGEAMKNAGSVYLLRFSPDGQRVVAAASGPLVKAVAIWDVRSDQAIPLKHPAHVLLHDAEFSPDGRYLATGGSDGVARLWNVETGEAESTALMHGGPVLQVKFSPDGHLLLTAGSDGSARLWNLAEMGFFVRTIKLEGDLNYAEFSPFDRYLVTAGDDGTARVWDAATGAPTGPPLTHAGEASYASFSHDERKVLTASMDNTARVWDWSSGQPVTPPLRHVGPVLYARFSDDDRLVVTASEDGTARLWTAENGEPAGLPLKHESVVRDAAISPDNKLLLTIADNRTVRLWEVTTGKGQTGHLDQNYPVGNPAHVEFSHDARRFLSVQGSAQVWDVATCKPITPPLTLGSAESYATFSPDGRRVATAAQDGTAQIWDAATGRAVTPPMRHQQAVWKVAFDHNGSRLATASLDKTARLWDATTGDPLTPPLRHSDRVIGVAFTADGRHLLTLTPRGVARIWDLPVASDSLERTERLVELMANRHALPAADASPLSLEELRHTWNVLQAQGAEPLATPPEALLRWHEREAVTSELLRQWEAVIFHLRPLIARHPDDTTLLHRRAIAYDRIGAWQAAVADDPTIRRSVPVRDTHTGPDLIDLSGYYNWPLCDFGQGLNQLDSLPTGIQTLGGVQFDVRGVIHLTDPSGTIEALKSVTIQLNRRCARLHFLHAAVFGLPQLDGRQIAKYIMHYAGGGQLAELPIIYGKQVQDWHCQPGEPWASNELEVVWKGTNRVSAQNNTFIRLFKTTWENPNPSLEIGTVELVPEQFMPSGVAPFVVAITADPDGAPQPAATAAKSTNSGLLPQIPPRDPQACPEQVDLSDFYNAGLLQDVLHHKGHNLATLSNGLQVFGGVRFDVRGLIRLAGASLPTNLSTTGPWDDDHGYPERVEGIPINRKTRGISFLQACVGRPAPEGTKIGSYVVHFVDHGQMEIPIIYGQNTAHWCADAPKAGMVWTASGPVPDLGISTKHLFKQTWINPSPDILIGTIDFISAMNPTTAPFLVAITVD
jgi:WD40 repeat protein